MRRSLIAVASVLAALMAGPASIQAQESARMERVPDRQPGEGDGPYRRLVIRNAMLIDGSGAPPRGPVDIVIAGNRITQIAAAGTPGLPLRQEREPRDADREIDATGMFVLPGFVDTHGHNGDPDKAPNATYGYRLWLAHGVTTVRGVGLYPDHEMNLSDQRRCRDNTIVAPRLFNYPVLGQLWSQGPVRNAEQARAWVRWAAAQGYDGVKFFNDPPAVMQAAVEEARRLNLGTVTHLSQGGVAEVNADRAGEMGMRGITHFYGHMESLLRDRRLVSYPNDYNMSDEQWRFSQVARGGAPQGEPGGPAWRGELGGPRGRGVTFSPTFNI